MKTQGERLAFAMKLRGFHSASELARSLEWKDSTVRHHVNGTRGFSADIAESYARKLNISAAWLLFNDGPPPKSDRPEPSPHHAPLQPITVIGAVQAGSWSEAAEWPPDDQFTTVAMIDQRFSKLKPIGLEVRGPSMNEIYPPGSIVICVNLIELERDPLPGEKVIVQRHRPDGLIEATVKELRQDATGQYWLWPRSNHPEFQQPWKLPKPDEIDQSDTIQITGLVIGSYRPEAIESTIG
jgi:SOS-response transcriptional repressor LexA